MASQVHGTRLENTDLVWTSQTHVALVSQLGNKGSANVRDRIQSDVTLCNYRMFHVQQGTANECNRFGDSFRYIIRNNPHLLGYTGCWGAYYYLEAGRVKLGSSSGFFTYILLDHQPHNIAPICPSTPETRVPMWLVR
jgi:hypothetical protein